ncbi:MAG: iron-sulfur cluster assembly protein, partial [Boseongicola sp.]
MGISENDILDALRRISLPNGGDLVSSDLVRALTIEGGTVRFV